MNNSPGKVQIYCAETEVDREVTTLSQWEVDDAKTWTAGSTCSHLQHTDRLVLHPAVSCDAQCLPRKVLLGMTGRALKPERPKTKT